jgi:hypothetical protein
MPIPGLTMVAVRQLTPHAIIFSANANNVNLRSVHDSTFGAPLPGQVVNVTVNGGVIIGATSTGIFAFTVGSWPAGVIINMTVSGLIEGAGGNGGSWHASAPGDPGVAGGPAIFTRQLINLTGSIWAGGGGGGASTACGGGGGAGTVPGAGGPGNSANLNGQPGTASAGGAGGPGGAQNGGPGGGPGLAGGSGSGGFGGGVGGQPGNAVDGWGFVNWLGGDIRGGLV